ncbi:MAG TPA: S8 family peptidase, partial [Pyrinomonadaceae bacterium]
MNKITSLFLIINLCVLSFAPAALGQRGSVPAPAAAPVAKLRKSADAIPGHYIVVFNESVAANNADALADALVRAHGGTLGFTYRSALRGFSVELSEAQAVALSRHPQVAFVESDVLVEGAATQTAAPWTLDRLDQRDLALNNSYTYASNGAGVNVYVIDGGIRLTHQEFGGRAVFAYDNVGDGRNGVDCNGHGTHVAATIGGATYGIAKDAKLHSVRVLNCLNQSPLARILAGIDWVTTNHVKPAVTNLSFATGLGNDAMDLAVRNSIAAGITYVVAAGNISSDAGSRSPARVAEAITVAATDQNDNQASFSNFGAVVDVYAPGVDIVSASSIDDTSTIIRSGTSFAAPLVAGLAARYLGARPGDQPDAVGQAIMNNATPGKVTNPGAGSPNLLAYAGITISDDFNDNSRDAGMWNVDVPASGNVVEQNGRVEVTPPADTAGYNGYYSVTTGDLTDSRVSVEVKPGAIGVYGPETLFSLAAGNDQILFATSGSNIIFQTNLAGVVSRTYIPYNATQHRFWRFRHNRTTDEVFWETSPDGVAWTVQRQMARPLPITNLQTRLLGGKYLAAAVAATTTFDNLWHEQNPTPPVILGDNFNDNLLDPRIWTPLYPESPVTVTEQNQRIELAITPNAAGYNGIVSASAFDLRDRIVQVEVPQTASQAGWVETFFQLYLDEGNYFTISSSNNAVACDVWINGVRDRSGSTWNGNSFWRYRHNIDANTVSFETSANGSTWTTLKTVAAPFALNALKARIISGAWGTGNSAPGTAIFDNFRIQRYRPLFPLSDNFNDNERDAKKWNAPANLNFTVVEQNGRLEITPGETATNYDGYHSATNIDLNDARVSVEAITAPGLNTYGTHLVLGTPTDYLLLGANNNSLLAQWVVNGISSTVSVPYNATQHRFWRLRHNRAANTVNWEYSPDDVTWTTYHSMSPPFAITGLQVHLIALKPSGVAPTATAIFDNLRIERN